MNFGKELNRIIADLNAKKFHKVIEKFVNKKLFKKNGKKWVKKFKLL